MNPVYIDAPIISNPSPQMVDFLTSAIRNFEKELQLLISKKKDLEILYHIHGRKLPSLFKKIADEDDSNLKSINALTKIEDELGTVKRFLMFLHFKKMAFWITCISIRPDVDIHCFYEEMDTKFLIDKLDLRKAQLHYLSYRDRHEIYHYGDNYIMTLKFHCIEKDPGDLRKIFYELKYKSEFDWDRPWFYYPIFLPIAGESGNPMIMQLSGTLKKVNWLGR